VQHLHVRAGDAADVARVARWVTGSSVGLVLGGGGARGWAHIGAVRAFEELGIPIDLVGGTSQGAVVAAAVADRRTAEDMQTSARPWVRKLRDYTVPMVSVLRGRRMGRTLEMIVRPGIAIEDLWLPYFAMTTNLSRAERVVQDRGSVVDALRASVSLPVVLPPVIRDGELFIDGGLLDNLPVGEMRRRIGTGRIIAIDPSPQSRPERFDPLEPDVSGVRLLAERLVPFRRRRRVPSIGEMVQRTVMAGSRHLRQRVADQDPSTLTLQPQLGDWGLLAFERLDEIVEAGYREMRDPIAAWWCGQQPPGTPAATR
jgi:predicted acylesterase/phospholipase RssA